MKSFKFSAARPICKLRPIGRVQNLYVLGGARAENVDFFVKFEVKVAFPHFWHAGTGIVAGWRGRRPRPLAGYMVCTLPSPWMCMGWALRTTSCLAAAEHASRLVLCVVCPAHVIRRSEHSASLTRAGHGRTTRDCALRLYPSLCVRRV